MKASDYAQRFKTEGCTVEALGRVVMDMIIEVRKIGEARKISRDEGLFSLLDEMNLKFETFHHQTGGKLNDGSAIRKEAFKGMIRVRMPDTFAGWNEHHKGRLLPS